MKPNKLFRYSTVPSLILLFVSAFSFQNCSGGFESIDGVSGAPEHPIGFITRMSPNSIDLKTRFWFFPNQLGAQEYYKPKGVLINGHWAESFSNFDYWPTLSRKIADLGGGIGLIITEIGHMTKAQIDDIRLRGLRIQVDEMQWTQCRDGYEAAQWEMFGGSSGGKTLADMVLAGAPKPYPGIYERGFFETRDGQLITPDEIVLDERIPNLLPYLDIAELTKTGGTWEERKARARRDPCPAATNFNAGVSRLEGLFNDYIEFARVVEKRWPKKTPRLSMNWNASHGWDLGRDERCFDEVRAQEMAAGRPDPTLNPENIASLRFPCHNGVPTLRDLIVRMCSAGHCPHTIYLDMDLSYNNDWLIEDLRRYRSLLNAVPLPDGTTVKIHYGLNIHDHCYGRAAGCYQNLANGRLNIESRSGSPNLLFEDSTLNVARFLSHHGVLDADTNVKFFTWDSRPYEVGSQVKESTPGSMAHAALAFLNQTPSNPAPRLVEDLPIDAIQIHNVTPTAQFTCDFMNPDAIKRLPATTIEWLGTIQPSGLTLHENYFVARREGYSGAFGRGEHLAWMNQDGERQTRFDKAIMELANAPVTGYANFKEHHVARRNGGYHGLFLCGGDACFQSGACDEYGRRK